MNKKGPIAGPFFECVENLFLFEVDNDSIDINHSHS